MNSDLYIHNCRLYTDTSFPTNILIRDGKIAAAGLETAPEGIPHLDAKNAIAVPGLIDVHIQGAGGADVLDGTEAALDTMAAALARLGTTGFLATTVVKPLQNNAHLQLVNNSRRIKPRQAAILGTHLEGPFIHPARKGGIDRASIYESSPEALNEILDATGDSLAMMTIAPELTGNHKIIALLREKGIIASFAHSTATYRQTREGFAAGLNHVTHICNAMEPLHHREPGPLAAIFEEGNAAAQIISDGHHLHPAMVRLLYRELGPDRCICITDGVQAMGLAEGRFVYNGREYDSKDGAAKYLDGTLIGSTMPLLHVVKRFLEFTGCSLVEAVHTASLNPARLLGLEKSIGTLGSGKDADIVLISDDFDIVDVLTKGVCI